MIAAVRGLVKDVTFMWLSWRFPRILSSDWLTDHRLYDRFTIWIPLETYSFGLFSMFRVLEKTS